jgi:hypothetical protein
VLYLVGNCINLCQFGEGFLLVYVLRICLEEKHVGLEFGRWGVGRCLDLCVRIVNWCYPKES